MKEDPPGGSPDPTVHRAYFPASDVIGRRGPSPLTVRYDAGAGCRFWRLRAGWTAARRGL